MTTRTRRALNRVRNHARSLVRAIDALRPEDSVALSYISRRIVGLTSDMARTVSSRLTYLLDNAEPPARKPSVKPAPTAEPGGPS